MSSFRQGLISITSDKSGLGYTAGYNGMHQLGVPGLPTERTDTTSRIHQLGCHKWRSIYAGDRFSIAIDTEGHLWGWGDNSLGQLGLGEGAPYIIEKPTRIHCNYAIVGGDTIKVNPDIRFTYITSYKGSVHAIDDSKRLWGWGDNTNNRLLVNSDTVYSTVYTPKLVNTAVRWHRVRMTEQYTVGITSRTVNTNGTYTTQTNKVYGWAVGDTSVVRVCKYHTESGSNIQDISAGDKYILLNIGNVIWVSHVNSQEGSLSTSDIANPYAMPTLIKGRNDVSIVNTLDIVHMMYGSFPYDTESEYSGGYTNNVHCICSEVSHYPLKNYVLRRGIMLTIFEELDDLPAYLIGAYLIETDYTVTDDVDIDAYVGNHGMLCATESGHEGNVVKIGEVVCESQEDGIKISVLMPNTTNTIDRCSDSDELVVSVGNDHTCVVHSVGDNVQ